MGNKSWDWGGFVFGRLFFILPVFLVYGYQIAVIRNVMRGDKKPLPTWEHWGEYFMDGLMVFVARFVYMLPALIPFCIGFLAFFLPALSGGDSATAESLAAVGAGVYFLMSCLGVLVAIVAGFVTPALHIQYAKTGELGSLFRFGEVFGIVRENVTDILLTFLAAFGANMVVQTVAGILFFTICGPFIIALVGTFWVMMANAHLYGQIGAKIGMLSPKKF